jgi:hypothetical protein
MVYLPSSGSLLTNDCSGAFFKEITRAALLTIVLGITVVLTTSCASTRNAVSTRLISAVGNNQQATNSKNVSWYQPTRSPGFVPDLFGG